LSIIKGRLNDVNERNTLGGAAGMRVLMAIEPRSYREVIGEAIRGLRPHLEVVIVGPDALEPEIARLDPELVIYSRPSIAATNGGSAWIEFRPYDQAAARIYVGGRQFELEEVELEDLLSVVDEAEWLARTGGSR
jgi:hypothetical protein